MKPHSGRVKPFARLSIASVIVSSGRLMPSRLTGSFARP